METIYFYNENEEYGYLSNYYVCPIYVDGKYYKSNEHYYQSQKSLDPDFAEKIRNAETCDDAKNLGNSMDCPIRPDWNAYRNVAMTKALCAKFTQHSSLKKMLLETGDALLVENSRHDYYWGCGEDKSGKNMLGRLLVATRDSLR